MADQVGVAEGVLVDDEVGETEEAPVADQVGVAEGVLVDDEVGETEEAPVDDQVGVAEAGVLVEDKKIEAEGEGEADATEGDDYFLFFLSVLTSTCF